MRPDAPMSEVWRAYELGVIGDDLRLLGGSFLTQDSDRFGEQKSEGPFNTIGIYILRAPVGNVHLATPTWCISERWSYARPSNP